MKQDIEKQKPDGEPAETPSTDTDPQPLRLSRAVEFVRLSEPRGTATPPPLAPPFAAVAARAGETDAGLRAPPVPEGDRWTGAALRRARQARGLSVAQLSERTKVTRHHIENIEGDQYELLPAPVYVRGILMALAKELRLDGQKVARAYLQAARDASGR